MSICNPGSPKFAPMVKIIQKISPTAANLFSAYSRNEIKPIAHAQSTKPVQDCSCLFDPSSPSAVTPTTSATTPAALTRMTAIWHSKDVCTKYARIKRI